jgi:hypothetical protein
MLEAPYSTHALYHKLRYTRKVDPALGLPRTPYRGTSENASSTHFGGKRRFTDEVVLACDGVDACDYLFDPERDATSLLTPRGLPAKSHY